VALLVACAPEARRGPGTLDDATPAPPDRDARLADDLPEPLDTRPRPADAGDGPWDGTTPLPDLGADLHDLARPPHDLTPDAGGGGGDAGEVDGGGRDGGRRDGGGGDGGEVDGGPEVAHRLVVVTLNTHSFQEGASSLAKLEQIGVGLAQVGADVVGLNEVMAGTFWAYDFGGAQHDGAALIRAALERTSGVPWHLARQGFAHWADGEEMSNVLLSRFPLLETDDAWLTTTDFWPAPGEQRNVLYGRIALPGRGPVNVFVTHTAGYDSVDVPAQVSEVRLFMAAKFRRDELLDLLLGDLNAPAGGPLYQAWLESPPFRLFDGFALAAPESFDQPTLVHGTDRIDFVLAGEGLPYGHDPARIRSRRIFDGTAVDGVVLPVVSDHYGVMTTYLLDP